MGANISNAQPKKKAKAHETDMEVNLKKMRQQLEEIDPQCSRFRKEVRAHLRDVHRFQHGEYFVYRFIV